MDAGAGPPEQTHIRVQLRTPHHARFLRALAWFKLDMDTTAMLVEPSPPTTGLVKHKNPSAYADKRR